MVVEENVFFYFFDFRPLSAPKGVPKFWELVKNALGPVPIDGYNFFVYKDNGIN